MPEENPETIVRKVHEAFGHRDLEAFLASWAEDGEYEPAMERDIEGDEGVFRGHEGIRRWWRSMSEAWNDWDSEVHKIRQAGSRCLSSAQSAPVAGGATW